MDMPLFQRRIQTLLQWRHFSTGNNSSIRITPILARREDFIPTKVSQRPLGQNEVSVFADAKQAMNERDCATLVILINLQGRENAASGEETFILFTHRAAMMKSHGNEISLPGGAIEQGESIEEAALREVEEEIGLDRRNLEIWGQLPPLLMRYLSGKMTPLVAAFNGDLHSLEPQLKPQSEEVQGIFLVPLNELIAGINFTSFRLPDRLKNGLPLYYRMPSFIVRNFQVLHPSVNEKYLPPQRFIWGLTASTVYEALLSILPKESPERRILLKDHHV